jgi:hypothetical protein
VATLDMALFDYDRSLVRVAARWILTPGFFGVSSPCQLANYHFDNHPDDHCQRRRDSQNADDSDPGGELKGK